MKSGGIKAHEGQECGGINTNPRKCQHPSFKVFDTKKKPITKENKTIGSGPEIQEENDAGVAKAKGYEENLKSGLKMN